MAISLSSKGLFGLYLHGAMINTMLESYEKIQDLCKVSKLNYGVYPNAGPQRKCKRFKTFTFKK